MTKALRAHAQPTRLASPNEHVRPESSRSPPAQRRTTSRGICCCGRKVTPSARMPCPTQPGA